MKTILKISFLVNVVLLGAAVFLWDHPRTVSAPVIPPATAAVELQATPPPATTVTQTVAETEPFRWNQLVSTNDYRAFVASLRAAGCPEDTVEDIVRGDTDRVYEMMRARLGISATEPGRWSAQAQAQMAAYLLGQSQTPTITQEIVADNDKTQPDDNQSEQTTDLTTFLQNTDFTTPEMTDEQKQEIAGLRQGLLAQISVIGQAANNPGSGSPQNGADNTAASQTGTSDTQPSQTGTGGERQLWHYPSADGQEESMIGGIFGMGAAMQYERSQEAQAQ